MLFKRKCSFERAKRHLLDEPLRQPHVRQRQNTMLRWLRGVSSHSLSRPARFPIELGIDPVSWLLSKALHKESESCGLIPELNLRA